MSQPTADGEAAPATMRAVVVTRPGGLDALEIQNVPVPVRKPGWVRIRVRAFGVNESEVRDRLDFEFYRSGDFLEFEIMRGENLMTVPVERDSGVTR